ncbi:hypothetical protein SuNHUV7_14550 (plasmid) [Pseudoseohaeicola sp. NH-UV-7]|uniref:GlsB/YeaQ/YmgE family stress response membrane protein n=1 Tax=Sulfitobacter sp. TBRI5 TaxID=2989732 RepID=UPI003A5E34DE
MALAAGPALAQEGAAEAVGTGLGLVIGLLIMIVVGAVVGWLAGLIVKGSGLGFWGDVVVGIGGSILAGFLFPMLGITIGTGFPSRRSISYVVLGSALPELKLAAIDNTYLYQSIR